jgi:hypothetical protein
MGINLPEESPHPSPWRLTLHYAACYLGWLLFVAFGFLLLLSLRINLFDLAIFLRLNPWQVRAVDRFAIFLLGLTWFAGIFILENYLRQGVAVNQLWSRIIGTTVALLVIGGISYLLQWLAGA